jgi:hypothetical protein
MKYKVLVQGAAVESVEVEVEAANKEEAGERAIERAEWLSENEPNEIELEWTGYEAVDIKRLR